MNQHHRSRCSEELIQEVLASLKPFTNLTPIPTLPEALSKYVTELMATEYKRRVVTKLPSPKNEELNYSSDSIDDETHSEEGYNLYSGDEEDPDIYESEDEMDTF